MNEENICKLTAITSSARARFVPLPQVGFDEALGWWRDYGCNEFRWLSHAARPVFGHPATAAAIERDFSSAGHMLSPTRSRLDAVYAEILMYLNLNFDSIPYYIPEILPMQVFKHLPKRLTKLVLLDVSIVTGLEDGENVDTSGADNPGVEAGVDETKTS